ncbi:tyrosine-type recombinase/integrase [Micromonospora sp. CPCC 205371]|nr:tyrosine-type recombinase/integrase [Micromonospora sp. CPCC 205371]
MSSPRFHGVRHSCAMSLLQAGVDTTVIALWLGHASVRSTDAYVHADMTTKEQALALTTPITAGPIAGDISRELERPKISPPPRTAIPKPDDRRAEQHRTVAHEGHPPAEDRDPNAGDRCAPADGLRTVQDGLGGVYGPHGPAPPDWPGSAGLARPTDASITLTAFAGGPAGFNERRGCPLGSLTQC